MSSKIEVVVGDITTLAADAVVNAANTHLRGGGGVDGAIHFAAGPMLLTELVERYPNGTQVGMAVETRAYNLPAKFIIHAVGPQWTGGSSGEANLLASAYASALKLADRLGCKSIAFPSISTGIYGYPIELASKVAIAAMKSIDDELENLNLIQICAFSMSDAEEYQTAINNYSI
jgi:O-acetyl-ADP-ribose deacetylase (regulator of RNase III)